MHTYYVTYGGRVKKDSAGEWESILVVVKTPALWSAIEWATEKFCVVTGHQFCMSYWLCTIQAAVTKRQTEFLVPVPDQEIIAFTDFRGWARPPFLDDRYSA